MKNFNHPALNLSETWPLVYTAMSKHLFYYRMYISKFVLEHEKVPLNPFMLFDYFLLDSIKRDIVRQANNAVLMRADEVWVFGPVSNGVLSEILIAQKTSKPVFYFQIQKPHNIMPVVLEEDIEMEADVKDHKHLIDPYASVRK